MINETNKIILEQFGSHVRNIRVSKKLTYRKVATQCNIDFSNLRRIEQGKLNITLITILELAKGLEVTASDLFKYEKE